MPSARQTVSKVGQWKDLVLLWLSPRKEPRTLPGLTGLHGMPCCKQAEWLLPQLAHCECRVAGW